MLLLGLLAPLAAVAARPFGIDWDKAYSPTSEPLMWNKVTYVKDGKLAASPGRTSIVPFWWWGAMRLGSHVGARSSFLGGPFGTSNFGSMAAPWAPSRAWSPWAPRPQVATVAV